MRVIKVEVPDIIIKHILDVHLNTLWSVVRYDEYGDVYPSPSHIIYSHL
jgi:hypothetical protein